MEDDIGTHRRLHRVRTRVRPGDVTDPAQADAEETDASGLSTRYDLRLPTGDERNLLGTGALASVRSCVVGKFRRVLAHLNAATSGTATAFSAASPAAVKRQDLPDLATYSAGAVIEVHPRITARVDVIGRYIIDSPRLQTRGLSRARQQSVFPNITFTTDPSTRSAPLRG
jgi:hypothetical protein